jgi:hypothetical protein
MPETNGRHASSESVQPAADVADPLTEAEAVKCLLTEAMSQLTRVITSLKQYRRQAKAVQAAVRSLKELPPLVP